MLSRRTPLQRTAWNRKQASRKSEENRAPAIDEKASAAIKPIAPLRRGTYSGSTTAVAPKIKPVRDEAYRRLVASLPCIRCGVVGYSQAAHPNTGKGAGSKADDTLCFPLCADRPGVRGCHPLFDQGALYSKEERRAIEVAWSQATRVALSRGAIAHGGTVV